MAKYVRLDEVTYPGGRVYQGEVQYDYGTAGAIDDVMSRLANPGDGKGKEKGKGDILLFPGATD